MEVYQQVSLEAACLDIGPSALDLHLRGQSPAQDSFYTDTNLTTKSSVPLTVLSSDNQKEGNGPAHSLCHELPLWPLQNAVEARLIRHYIQNVSRLFDMCDSQRHFALVVPCIAASCPDLMNAAFTWLLSQKIKTNERRANKYYQMCLVRLVPLFDDPKALENENLCAAIVILRTL